MAYKATSLIDGTTNAPLYYVSISISTNPYDNIIYVTICYTSLIIN